jgi:hypothetical protein
MNFTRSDITTLNGIKIGKSAKNFIPALVNRTDLSSRTYISTSQIMEERTRLLQEFPNLVLSKNVMFELKTLDQSGDGACTIASLFNLMHIEGKDDLHPKKKSRGKMKPMLWSQIKQLTKQADMYGQFHGTYFGKQVYDKITDYIEKTGNRPDKDAQDYQEMLEVGLELKIPAIVNVLNDPDFRYVPVSSRNFREAYLNKKVAGDDQTEVYIHAAKYIEHLIDKGVAVGFSSNGHARVIVGYNEHELVILDSWGDNFSIEQAKVCIGKDCYQDKFKAGFSVMSKWVVYGDMRDLIYFEPSLASESKINIKTLKF